MPVGAALAKLPEFGAWENQGTREHGKRHWNLVQAGQSVSKPVTTASVLKCGNKNPSIHMEKVTGCRHLSLCCCEKSNGGEGGIRTPGAY